MFKASAGFESCSDDEMMIRALLDCPFGYCLAHYYASVFVVVTSERKNFNKLRYTSFRTRPMQRVWFILKFYMQFLYKCSVKIL